MLQLRELQENDIPVILSWPPYPEEFRDLDYALRTGGWIDEYRHKPGCIILVAIGSGSIEGFSLLTFDLDRHAAEFRIALHPDVLGKGRGRELAVLTVRYGFREPSLDRIRLIVRKNNSRARHLYESLHFRMTGECTEVIQGKIVEFFTMELDRATFQEADIL